MTFDLFDYILMSNPMVTLKFHSWQDILNKSSEPIFPCVELLIILRRGAWGMVGKKKNGMFNK